MFRIPSFLLFRLFFRHSLSASKWRARRSRPGRKFYMRKSESSDKRKIGNSQKQPAVLRQVGKKNHQKKSEKLANWWPHLGGMLNDFPIKKWLWIDLFTDDFRKCYGLKCCSVNLLVTTLKWVLKIAFLFFGLQWQTFVKLWSSNVKSMNYSCSFGLRHNI